MRTPLFWDYHRIGFVQESSGIKKLCWGGFLEFSSNGISKTNSIGLSPDITKI